MDSDPSDPLAPLGGERVRVRGPAKIPQQQPGGDRLRRQQKQLAVRRERIVVVPRRPEDQEQAGRRQGRAFAAAGRFAALDREQKSRRQQHRQNDQRVRAVRVVRPEHREAGLIDVVDERRLVVDDVAVQEIAARHRVGGRGVDRLVVGQHRAPEGRQPQDDPQEEGRKHGRLERPHAQS